MSERPAGKDSWNEDGDPPGEIRRLTPYFGQLPPGRGWRLACPGCGGEVATQEHGRCPACQHLPREALPVVADAEVRFPTRLRRGRLLSRLLLQGTLPLWLPALLFTIASTLLSSSLHPFLEVLGIGLFGLTTLVTPPMLLAMPLLWLLLYRRYARYYPSSDPTHRVICADTSLPQLWYDLTKVRGRRCLVVQLSLEVHGQRSRRVEVMVRLRGPDGRYLAARLRRYRASTGELLLRHRTQPLRHERARFPHLWLACPIRALWLPPGCLEVRLTAEVLVAVQGEVRVERDLPVRFFPLPEDFPDALPAAAGAAAGLGELHLLTEEGAGDPAEEVTCPVCGDPLGEEPVRCRLCETPHHRECWDWVGGCTTFACEGRPEEVPGV